LPEFLIIVGLKSFLKNKKGVQQNEYHIKKFEIYFLVSQEFLILTILYVYYDNVIAISINAIYPALHNVKYRIIITKCGKARVFKVAVFSITKCDKKVITKCDRYYKVWQLLQSAAQHKESKITVFKFF